MRLAWRWAGALFLAIIAAGCVRAPAKRAVGVPIEASPRLPTPLEIPASVDTLVPVPVPPAAEESVPEHDPILARIVADSTAARAAVNRCRGHSLLPDQEGIYDATVQLLIQVRAALEADERPRAQSLARRARQLATSLTCR